MTNKRSWLEKIVTSVVGSFVRIGGQVRGISLSIRRRISPKWFFWVKLIVLLMALSWVLLLIMSGFVYIVYMWIAPPGRIEFENSRKEVVNIYQVAVDGRTVLVDKRRRIGQGFELSRGMPEYLHPGNMRPNTTHIILVRASSASAPALRGHVCVIFIPPKPGSVSIYFENREDFRCQFWEDKGY